MSAAGRGAARRHAELVAAHADCGARIEALTEQLAEAEWIMRQAEDEVGVLLHRADLPMQVYGAATEPPDESVKALLSLDDGRAFVRDEQRGYDTEHPWILADANPRHATHYPWPLDGRGPWIAFPDNYHLRQVLRAVADGQAFADAIRNILRSREGYEEPGKPSPWYRPELADALTRVLDAEFHRRVDLSTENRALGFELRDQKTARRAERELLHAALVVLAEHPAAAELRLALPGAHLDPDADGASQVLAAALADNVESWDDLALRYVD